MKIIPEFHDTIHSPLGSLEIISALASITEPRREKGLHNSGTSFWFKRNILPFRGVINDNQFVITMNRRNTFEHLTISGQVIPSENGTNVSLTFSLPKSIVIHHSLLFTFVTGLFLAIFLIDGFTWLVVLITILLFCIALSIFYETIPKDHDKAIILLKNVFKRGHITSA